MGRPSAAAGASEAGLILEARDLSIAFGGLSAVTELSFSVQPLELCGLIGPNGAGKTTLFNLLTGIYRPDAGELELSGKSILGLPPHAIAKAGIARTFQNIRLFKEMSLLDNIKVSFHMRKEYTLGAALLRTRGFVRGERILEEEARDLLALFALDSKRHLLPKSLPYGDQRRLEIARALAARPKLLLLDEPAAGLNSSEKETLMSVISRIRERFRIAILVIEHDMRLVMGICSRIFVLDYGQLIAEGPPSSIQKNAKVIEAYLGSD